MGHHLGQIGTPVHSYPLLLLKTLYMYDVVRQTERLSESSIRRRESRSANRNLNFVRGPIPVSWVRKVTALGGKAVSVGLACWFVHGCGRENKSICPKLLAQFGMNRKAGYRGLRALERAGLVKVERAPGRCPRVAIVVKPTGETA